MTCGSKWVHFFKTSNLPQRPFSVEFISHWQRMGVFNAFSYNSGASRSKFVARGETGTEER